MKRRRQVNFSRTVWTTFHRRGIASSVSVMSSPTGGLPDRIGPAPRSITVDPGSPETVFVGLNDGGIWATRDAGDEFSRIAEGCRRCSG